MPNVVHLSSDRSQAQQESRRSSSSSSESSDQESDNEEEGARKAEGLEPVQEGSEHSSSSDDAGYAKSDAEEEEVAVKRTLEIQDSVPVTQERKHSDTGSVTSSSSCDNTCCRFSWPFVR